MRWLEVRRHSLTKKGPARGRGSHLSAQGIALARAVGAQLRPVAYVLTSASPRAIETAIAMGLAVDDTVQMPSGYVPGEVEFHQQWEALFGHCDGARLGFADGRFVDLQFRRAPVR
jgi:hypothetical protein